MIYRKQFLGHWVLRKFLRGEGSLALWEDHLGYVALQDWDRLNTQI
jgi:hypothetical protein